MKDQRDQQPAATPQARQKHPDEWQRDLNPNHIAGPNVGPQADPRPTPERTAFQLRTAGAAIADLDDESLKQVPVLSSGARLQQGATYADLNTRPPREFTARGDLIAGPDDAFVPKDRVAYEVWNRLIGEPKPGE